VFPWTTAIPCASSWLVLPITWEGWAVESASFADNTDLTTPSVEVITAAVGSILVATSGLAASCAVVSGLACCIKAVKYSWPSLVWSAPSAINPLITDIWRFGLHLAKRSIAGLVFRIKSARYSWPSVVWSAPSAINPLITDTWCSGFHLAKRSISTFWTSASVSTLTCVPSWANTCANKGTIWFASMLNKSLSIVITPVSLSTDAGSLKPSFITTVKLSGFVVTLVSFAKFCLKYRTTLPRLAATSSLSFSGGIAIFSSLVSIELTKALGLVVSNSSLTSIWTSSLPSLLVRLFSLSLSLSTGKFSMLDPAEPSILSLNSLIIGICSTQALASW